MQNDGGWQAVPTRTVVHSLLERPYRCPPPADRGQPQASLGYPLHDPDGMSDLEESVVESSQLPHVLRRMLQQPQEEAAPHSQLRHCTESTIVVAIDGTQ